MTVPLCVIHVYGGVYSIWLCSSIFNFYYQRGLNNSHKSSYIIQILKTINTFTCTVAINMNQFALLMGNSMTTAMHALLCMVSTMLIAMSVCPLISWDMFLNIPLFVIWEQLWHKANRLLIMPHYVQMINIQTVMITLVISLWNITTSWKGYGIINTLSDSYYGQLKFICRK